MPDDSDDAAPMQLPRRLAIRLLHVAQRAGERPFDAVVTRPARSVLPDQMAMLEAADAEPNAAGAVTWAIYLFRPGRAEAPAPQDFTALPQTLRLTASLATKGVLQLHAWRCIDGVVREVPLRIAD